MNGELNKHLTLHDFIKQDWRFENKSTLFYPGTTKNLYPYKASVPRTQIYGAYRTFFSGRIGINAKSVKNFESNPESYMVNVPVDQNNSTGKTNLFIEEYDVMSGFFKDLEVLKMEDIKSIGLLKKGNEQNLYVTLMENSKVKYVKKKHLVFTPQNTK